MGTDDRELKLPKAVRKNGIDAIYDGISKRFCVGSFLFVCTARSCNILTSSPRARRKCRYKPTRFMRTTEQAHHNAVTHLARAAFSPILPTFFCLPKALIHSDHVFMATEVIAWPSARLDSAAWKTVLRNFFDLVFRQQRTKSLVFLTENEFKLPHRSCRR